MIPQKAPPVETDLTPQILQGDPIHVCLAALQPRERTLALVVESFLTQLRGRGSIHVCLNDWDHVPEFLQQEGVDFIRSQDPQVKDLGDAGKFWWLQKVEGYYLTVDDDWAYPLDYVDTLVDAVDFHDRKVVCGFHGVDFKKPSEWTVGNGFREVYPCGKEVARDRWVHMLGTGVCGFHTSTLPHITQAHFRLPNMADNWLALECQLLGVPMLCLRHDNGFLVDLDPGNYQCIWRSCCKSDSSGMDTRDQQKALVRKVRWEHAPNDPMPKAKREVKPPEGKGCKRIHPRPLQRRSLPGGFPPPPPEPTPPAKIKKPSLKEQMRLKKLAKQESQHEELAGGR